MNVDGKISQFMNLALKSYALKHKMFRGKMIIT